MCYTIFECKKTENPTATPFSLLAC